MHQAVALNKRVLAAGLLIGGALLFFTFNAQASSATLLPAADGTNNAWTPKTGTSHFAMVKESSCDGTTSYNSTTVVGNRDSYVVSTSSVPNGATITQISILPCASRNGTGSGTSVMNVFYRFGGASSTDQGSYSFTTGNTPTNQATTTYSGLSLVQTPTTTLEVGAVYTSGTKGLRLSRVATVVTYTALVAPSGLSGSATTTSAINLTWSAASTTNESGFTVERSADGINWSGLATTSADVTSYYDGGLAASSTFSYRVRAFNAGAYSSYTNVVRISSLDNPPADPTDLVAVASSTAQSITLNWTDNATNEISYEILRSINGVSYAHLATTSANATSYTSTAVASTSTTYYFEVRAYNVGHYSNVSNSATTTTFNVPLTPTGLSLTNVPNGTSTDVVLNWTDNSTNELGFKIERALASGTLVFKQIATSTVDSISYTDPLLPPNTYVYRLRAYNGYGNSVYTDNATTTTP